jgi:Uma2 family endonuclease
MLWKPPVIQRSLTAEEFSERRGELPDGGQWAELVRGVPVSQSAPDVDQGTIVLNLSKALADYVQSTLRGYPCFDLGLKVESRPDTVLFPAVSYFLEGERFAETDKDFTETIPALVVELLSGNQRRQTIQERVSAYLRHGVQEIWLIDPDQRAVYVTAPGQTFARRVSEAETLRGEPLLAGLRIAVSDLFALPDWVR